MDTNHDYNKAVGKNLITLMEMFDIKDKDMADVLGTSIQGVKDICSGKVAINLDELIGLRTQYGVNIKWLLTKGAVAEYIKQIKIDFDNIIDNKATTYAKIVKNPIIYYNDDELSNMLAFFSALGIFDK